MTFTEKVRAEIASSDVQLFGRRAFVRDCFLRNGVLSNPQTTYHIHFRLDSPTAQKLCDILVSFNLHPKRVARGEHFRVYIKEAEEVCEVLRIMGAHKSLLALEQIRVEKSVRNSINRKVNIEAANLSKTANAALGHIDAIEYIDASVGLDTLPPALWEVARLRMSNVNLSLAELGLLANPPLSKSGINHRLRKICEAAEDLRQGCTNQKAGEEVGKTHD